MTSQRSTRALHRWLAGCAIVLSVAACGGPAADADGTDPSKLSDELEANAQAIEDRATAAVRAAEAAADADLARLNAEAQQAVADQRNAAADGDASNPPATTAN